MKSIAGATVGLVALLGATNGARADVAALFADGHGGIASGAATRDAGGGNQSTPGLGYRLGARLLLFEGYFDHTGFGEGAAVSRGIVGVRGGFGSSSVRLVLRAGAGIIDEHGGALTGRLPGTPDRRGGVGRIGAAIEGRIAPLLLVGLGIDGESFALPATTGPFGPTQSTIGSDVFANLHLMFELGI